MCVPKPYDEDGFGCRASGARRGAMLTLPNILTLSRIVTVPLLAAFQIGRAHV